MKSAAISYRITMSFPGPSSVAITISSFLRFTTFSLFQFNIDISDALNQQLGLGCPSSFSDTWFLRCTILYVSLSDYSSTVTRSLSADNNIETVTAWMHWFVIFVFSIDVCDCRRRTSQQVVVRLRPPYCGDCLRSNWPKCLIGRLEPNQPKPLNPSRQNPKTVQENNNWSMDHLWTKNRPSPPRSPHLLVSLVWTSRFAPRSRFWIDAPARKFQRTLASFVLLLPEKFKMPSQWNVFLSLSHHLPRFLQVWQTFWAWTSGRQNIAQVGLALIGMAMVGLAHVGRAFSGLVQLGLSRVNIHSIIVSYFSSDQRYTKVKKSILFGRETLHVSIAIGSDWAPCSSQRSKAALIVSIAHHKNCTRFVSCAACSGGKSSKSDTCQPDSENAWSSSGSCRSQSLYPSHQCQPLYHLLHVQVLRCIH